MLFRSDDYYEVKYNTYRFSIHNLLNYKNRFYRNKEVLYPQWEIKANAIEWKMMYFIYFNIIIDMGYLTIILIDIIIYFKYKSQNCN